MNQIQPLSQSQLASHNEPQSLVQTVPVMQTTTTGQEQTSQNQPPTQSPDPLPRQDASQTPQPATPIPKSSFWSTLLPSSKAPITDGRYDHFITEKIDGYPLGYPSVAQFISTDIDGRIYRRFSFLRNRLLLRRQDELVCLEDKLNKIDDEESRGDDDAKYRLVSRRYDEEVPADCRRKPVLDDIEKVLREYDGLLLREHQIMSIKKAGKKLHKGLFDFILNGRLEEGVKLKHLCPEEYPYLYRRDDFLILGTQEDAWLGTHVESIKSFMPKKLRDPQNVDGDFLNPLSIYPRVSEYGLTIWQFLLVTSEDKEKAGGSNISFYSNERLSKFVKAIVCAATTVLLVLPIVILYVLSVHAASGGIKIGVLVIFTVAFSMVLAIITNASRSEMFGASAGYCAVLIVFLTYSGS